MSLPNACLINVCHLGCSSKNQLKDSSGEKDDLEPKRIRFMFNLMHALHVQILSNWWTAVNRVLYIDSGEHSPLTTQFLSNINTESLYVDLNAYTLKFQCFQCFMTILKINLATKSY